MLMIQVKPNRANDVALPDESELRAQLSAKYPLLRDLPLEAIRRRFAVIKLFNKKIIKV